MAQKIKLSTIAETLGVSTATVSLALRDSPLVAAATRDRIKELDLRADNKARHWFTQVAQ